MIHNLLFSDLKQKKNEIDFKLVQRCLTEILLRKISKKAFHTSLKNSCSKLLTQQNSKLLGVVMLRHE